MPLTALCSHGNCCSYPRFSSIQIQHHHHPPGTMMAAAQTQAPACSFPLQHCIRSSSEPLLPHAKPHPRSVVGIIRASLLSCKIIIIIIIIIPWRSTAATVSSSTIRTPHPQRCFVLLLGIGELLGKSGGRLRRHHNMVFYKMAS
jgi:hypothetical protein